MTSNYSNAEIETIIFKQNLKIEFTQLDIILHYITLPFIIL